MSLPADENARLFAKAFGHEVRRSDGVWDKGFLIIGDEPECEGGCHYYRDGPWHHVPDLTSDDWPLRLLEQIASSPHFIRAEVSVYTLGGGACRLHKDLPFTQVTLGDAEDDHDMRTAIVRAAQQALGSEEAA